MAILIFLDLLVSCLLAINDDNNNKICMQTGSSLGMQAQNKRATETRETIVYFSATVKIEMIYYISLETEKKEKKDCAGS
jgi:hypothetical protein